MITELCLASIHWRVAKDPWTIAIFQAGGSQFDIQANRIVDIYTSDDFEKLSLKYIEMYEEEFGIPSDDDKTLADRRALIEASWKKVIPPTKEAIESIVAGWTDAGCEVTAGAGYIELFFYDTPFTDEQIQEINALLYQVIPAHLSCNIVYKYMKLKEVYSGEVYGGEVTL
jgi:hypothetical protein